MSTTSHMRRMLAVILTALAWLTPTSGVQAQVAWSPPCGSIRIINRGPCTAQVDLVSTPAVFFFNFITSPANSTIVVPHPTPLTMDGIQSISNTFYPWVATLAPPPPGIPGSAIWWIQAVPFGPAPGCCWDLYLDPPSCTMYMLPSAGPCNP